MISVIDNCTIAKSKTAYLASLSTAQKNEMLVLIADALIKNKSYIIAQNDIDIKNCNKPKHIIDRLMLNDNRIDAMAIGLRQLVDLSDPIGEVVEEWTNSVGLILKRIRVPFGVVGIIYEARPNVTADAIGLCLKTGNAVVLRGSRDAFNSNLAIVNVAKDALNKNGFDGEFIQLISDLSHESSTALMTARGLVDVLIPRGSANLINAVVSKSSVPVIETGTGNCHAYIHSSADYNIAFNSVINGKLRRTSVCNATESLLFDESIAPIMLPKILSELKSQGVSIFGCDKTRALFDCDVAKETDYYTEYLDMKISCKIVKDFCEAVSHINKYGSGHSETIIANDKNAIDYFMKLVDSAVVYNNAPTSFTDGFEFGLGAEMGISTQKLHARGPMGLRELTSTKYCVFGNGQTRK